VHFVRVLWLIDSLAQEAALGARRHRALFAFSPSSRPLASHYCLPLTTQLTAVALEKARQLEVSNKKLTEELGKAKDTARLLKTEKVLKQDRIMFVCFVLRRTWQHTSASDSVAR
jgi:hypothetical protein